MDCAFPATLETGEKPVEGIAVSRTALVAATGVSFADTPAPSAVQIGNLNLFAGHHLVLLPGIRVCAP